MFGTIIISLSVLFFVLWYKYYEHPGATERRTCPYCGKRKGVLTESKEGRRLGKDGYNCIEMFRTYGCRNCGKNWDDTVYERISKITI